MPRRRSGTSAPDLAVRDGAILDRGQPTGQDYWSLAGAVDLSRNATGSARIKKAGEYTVVGQSAARVDLAAKVFGEAAFIHDMKLDGMAHARVVRQPRPGATIAAIDEAAIRRAAKGQPIEIVRDGNFVAIVGSDETVVEAVAAVAPAHVRWDGVEPLSPFQEEARWLLQQPSLDREVGAPPADPVSRRDAARGDFHPDEPVARLDRAVLRRRRVSRRQAGGVDAFAGRVPAARGAGADPEARSGGDRRASRAGAGLLRP